MSEDQGTRTDSKRPGKDGRSFGLAVRQSLRTAFLENATLKLVAFMLALTVFFLVHSDKRAVVNLTVGVSYSPPAGKVLASRPPTEVRLTVRGSRRLIKRVDEREVERIHVDLPDTNGEFSFQNDMVRLPAGLELVAINPASFPLRVEVPAVRDVPIEIRLVGRVAKGYEVVGRAVEPDQVEINGPESLVKGTAEVLTRPISLDGRAAAFVEEVALSSPGEFLAIGSDIEKVRVRVDVAPKITTRKLGKQTVIVTAGPSISPDTASRFVVEPAEIDVTLSGPLLALESIEAVRLEVSVAPTDLVPGAARSVPVLIRGLPDGVASELRPAEVKLKLP
ncbi:MAG: hypothetical protein KJO07_24545 [Deltaproteobacteria bacterium]|nr:hypothetical protein [Deltaproteobacteria bacterium]